MLLFRAASYRLAGFKIYIWSANRKSFHSKENVIQISFHVSFLALLTTCVFSRGLFEIWIHSVSHTSKSRLSQEACEELPCGRRPETGCSSYLFWQIQPSTWGALPFPPSLYATPILLALSDAVVSCIAALERKKWVVSPVVWHPGKGVTGEFSVGQETWVQLWLNHQWSRRGKSRAEDTSFVTTNGFVYLRVRQFLGLFAGLNKMAKGAACLGIFQSKASQV